MTKSFQRERRYLVFKNKDMDELLSEEDRLKIQKLADKLDTARAKAGKEPFLSVVVESDWPEYEPVWAMIERRVSGADKPQAGQLQNLNDIAIGTRLRFEGRADGVVIDILGVPTINTETGIISKCRYATLHANREISFDTYRHDGRSYHRSKNDITEVKPFRYLHQTKHSSERQKGNCFTTCLAMLLGLEISDIPEFEEIRDPTGWHLEFFNWQKANGIELVNVQDYQHGLAIANGTTSRGTKHSVIYLNGKPFADPHPSEEFLEEVENFWVLEDEIYPIEKPKI